MWVHFPAAWFDDTSVRQCYGSDRCYQRGEMAIPERVADAEADCGTPAVLPSMPSGENVVLLRKRVFIMSDFCPEG